MLFGVFKQTDPSTVVIKVLDKPCIFVIPSVIDHIAQKLNRMQVWIFMCIPQYLFSQSASFIMEFLFWVTCWLQLTSVIVLSLFILIPSSCWILLISRPENTKLCWNLTFTLLRICVFWRPFKLPSAEDFNEYIMTDKNCWRMWMEFLWWWFIHLVRGLLSSNLSAWLISLMDTWDMSRVQTVCKNMQKDKTGQPAKYQISWLEISLFDASNPCRVNPKSKTVIRMHSPIWAFAHCTSIETGFLVTWNHMYIKRNLLFCTSDKMN